MPTSLAGICLLCGPGSAARTQLCLVSVRLPDYLVYLFPLLLYSALPCLLHRLFGLE